MTEAQLTSCVSRESIKRLQEQKTQACIVSFQQEWSKLRASRFFIKSMSWWFHFIQLHNIVNQPHIVLFNHQTGGIGMGLTIHHMRVSALCIRSSLKVLDETRDISASRA